MAAVLATASYLLETILPPDRYGDSEDPIGGTLFWPSDPWSLADQPAVAPWARLAAQLTGTERPNRETPIAVGQPVSQQPITGPTAMNP